MTESIFLEEEIASLSETLSIFFLASFSIGLSFFISEDLSTSFESMFLLSVISIIIGSIVIVYLSPYYPALKATKIDVLDVLRNE